MFRDSHGVVHTVSSADPLDDLPEAAAEVLARALLVPGEGDLIAQLERCEAVVDLLERWQDAFFAALPPEVDLEEEARWASQAGVDLAEVEDGWEGDDEGDDLDADDAEPLEAAGEPDLFLGSWGADLHEETVAELESALMLLPMRVRLEALVAAASLVSQWTDLLADHEKCLGHLVLAHGACPVPAPHAVLVDQHAMLHAGHAHHA